MKLIYGISVSMIISVLLSYIFNTFSITENVANTLFTIAGIMFSIGTSLVVTINTSGIKNRTIRDGIRFNMKSIRNKFIVSFGFAALIFIIYILFPNLKNEYYNKSWFLLILEAYIIIYFIINFISIQELHEQIEDAIS